MKLNYNFAKPVLKADGTPDYAPAILEVVTHHHEEWDEPVLDPETGEPVIDSETGEPVTERKSRDWDTTETKMWPTAADYLLMGYVLVLVIVPADPAPEGHHWAVKGWESTGDAIRRTYEAVKDPPPPPKVYSRLYLEAALLKRGLLPAFDALIDSQTIENPPGSGNVMPLRRAYDTANDLSTAHPLFEQYFAAAKTALGVDDATAEEIMSECLVEGV